jgi:hypothetical protein
MKHLGVKDLSILRSTQDLVYGMPFAAFCKKCKKKEISAGNDNSYAYMIGSKLDDIKVEISKHFKNVHNIVPNPAPESLSWNEDFKKEEIELSQYGGVYADMSHLYWTFKGPSVRQFKSDDYEISVITFHHYDQCIAAIKNKGRIDIELFEYF